MPQDPRTKYNLWVAAQSAIGKAWKELKNPPGNLDSPEARRAVLRHFYLIDHAIVRVFWTNQAEIAPGVLRSNQPSPARIARWARKGIKSVLTLRGAGHSSPLLLEREACARHGITLHNVAISARALPDRDTLLELIALMAEIEKPFVIHCKSGSDRTGLAAALYRITVLGHPVDKARSELHWRYLHFRNSDTGVLDAIFDTYERDNTASPIAFIDWLSERYDPEAISAAWAASRSGGRSPP
ncbi:MAG: tyrosine-protein phosphatase [Pseudomonadota bacterium]